jgi:hypothetical protein
MKQFEHLLSWQETCQLIILRLSRSGRDKAVTHSFFATWRPGAIREKFKKFVRIR